MQGDTETRKKKRRKKKSKFWYYLYAVVILLLTIINITLATLLLTHVQSIKVVGNKNSQKNEIIAWVKEDPLTVNSLYTLWKFKSHAYELPIYLKDVDVSLKAPWKVQINVSEKEMIACVLAESEYLYFDAEGLVLKKSYEHEEGTPLIEGIHVENAEQFEYLQVDNEKVFSYIVNLTEEVANQELSPDRIAWEEDSMNLYFGDICAKLGKSNFDIKLAQLKPNLAKVKGESGTFQMEHYTSDSKNFSFEKNY